MKGRSYVVCGVCGVLFSLVGWGFAATGGNESAYTIGGLLLLSHVAISTFVIIKAKQGKGVLYAPLLVSPMLIVFIGAWLYHAAWIAIYFNRPDSDEFAHECASIGPTYKHVPSTPPRSVA